MNDRSLWVFGDSFSMSYDLDHELGWPSILAKTLGMILQTHAQPAADNFYIYSSYQAVRNQIDPDDIAVIGWSHHSRKSFVLDRKHPTHLEMIDQSLTYRAGNIEFIRSKNSLNNSKQKMLNFLPSATGKKFYDIWFRDYYSEFEQRILLQSFADSVKISCPSPVLQFFFRKDDVDGLDIDSAGYVIDFILDNNCSFSENDMHFNPIGHKKWADHLFHSLGPYLAVSNII